MADYGVAGVDLTTGKIYDDLLPSRLDPSNLTENIQDTAGGMIVLQPPLSGGYNDTLGQYTIGLSSTGANSVGKTCRIYRNGVQTVTAGAITAVACNTLDRNDDTTFYTPNTTTNRITVLQPGNYIAYWACRLKAATSGQRYTSIAVNGTSGTRAEVGRTTGELHTQSSSAPLRLAANDFVQLCLFVDTAASVDVDATTAFHTWFALVYQGA
jgi:hypothetical protein